MANFFKIMTVCGMVGFCMPLNAFSICDSVQNAQLTPAMTSQFESCALDENDDAVQLKLAQAYRFGSPLQKNMQRALLFYHLSAENGNAVAQTELAQFLLALDSNSTSRETVQSYLRKIQINLKDQSDGEFKGNLLHPYTLLALAAEPAENKWFYTSDTLTSDTAADLLKKYKIADDKKKKALKDASTWKQQKMMQVAKEIYSAEKYDAFKSIVMPTVGQSDAFSRKQAMEKLKQDIKLYKGE